MKKYFKTTATVLMSLVLTVLLFGFTVSAEELTFGDYSYVLLEDGSVKIAAYNGKATAVAVPGKIDGKDVTVIGSGAFSQNNTINSLVIPGSVKTIDNNAVTFCTKLNTVTINEGALTELPNRAITNCAALKTVKLPSNVTSIGTFEQCLALNNITVASGNKSLKNSGGVIYSADMKTLIKFPQGKKVAEYYIPTSVTKIAKNAFYEVQNPVKVYIPLTLKEIEGLPFAYSKVTLYYEGSSVPAAWKEAVNGFKFTVNGYKLGKTSKITSTAGANSLKLNWSAVYGANCYRVYQRVGNSWKKLADVKKTTYTVNNTKYGTKYTFAVTAGKINNGKTTWAKVYTAHTAVAQIPATAKITSTQTVNSIKLTWNAVKGVDGYRVFVKNNSVWKTLSTQSALTYTYKNLKAGTKYTFAVMAYKKVAGKIMWSNVYTTLATATKPVAPSKVTATQGVDWIKLTWTASKGATGYRIYYKNGNNWVLLKKGLTSTSYTFENLAAGTKRTYAVRPYVTNGNTVVWGNHTTYDAAVKPAATTVTLTNPAIGQINVKWTAVKGATEYRLFYKKNSEAYKLYKTYTSPQTVAFKNLKCGDTYTFVVRAGVKTTAGVVLGGYTPKVMKVPYRVTKYMNILKSGVFTMKYTVGDVTQTIYFDGKNIAYDYYYDDYYDVSHYTLLYRDGDTGWTLLDHDTRWVEKVSGKLVEDLSTPEEMRVSLEWMTVPEKFTTTSFKQGNKTYYAEYFLEDGIYTLFYFDGTTLIGIEQVNEAGESFFINIRELSAKVPSDAFVIPEDYDIVQNDI